MTVTTVNAVIADVMFVTELNWLLSLNPLARIPCGAIQLNRDPQQSNNNKNSTVDGDSRQRVGAVMEDLWHLWVSLTSRGASQTNTLADEPPTNLSQS